MRPVQMSRATGQQPGRLLARRLRHRLPLRSFRRVVLRCSLHKRTRPAALARGLNEPGVFFAAACRRAALVHTRQTGRQYDDDEARPHVSRIAEACNGSSAREFRLHLAAEPGLFQTRCARRDRRKAGFSDLQSDRPHRDDAQQGGRVSPFRLERLFVGLVAARRARLPRAPLSHHPRYPVVPDLHRRHEAGSDQGEDSQDHRAGGNLQEDRLLAAAHDPLRAGRHLRQHARRRRQGWHRWTARRLHHGLRDVRGPRTVGDRSRSANTAL